jgi:IS4 transposase
LMVARHKSSRSALYRPLPCPWMATGPAVCPVADLAELYRRRWEVETSLAHVKTTMQMDVLPGKPYPVF